MEATSDTTKTVLLAQPSSSSSSSTSKTKNQRKETIKWKFDAKYLEFDRQWECLQSLDLVEEVRKEMKRQIQHKISSYKMQDIHKNKYDEDKFVNFPFVVSLLIEKRLRCFYCKESVYIFYNYVRENRQWTLERMNNAHGHNTDNVEVACLHCNLRRGTMYHERYVFTKQLHVVKLG